MSAIASTSPWALLSSPLAAITQSRGLSPRRPTCYLRRARTSSAPQRAQGVLSTFTSSARGQESSWCAQPSRALCSRPRGTRSSPGARLRSSGFLRRAQGRRRSVPRPAWAAVPRAKVTSTPRPTQSFGRTRTTGVTSRTPSAKSFCCEFTRSCCACSIWPWRSTPMSIVLSKSSSARRRRARRLPLPPSSRARTSPWLQSPRLFFASSRRRSGSSALLARSEVARSLGVAWLGARRSARSRSRCVPTGT
eukprot:Amastigsp_a6316_16.p2 type:complete len:250 gc:universal Amastigsp_a6316_16:917-168(-)